MSDTLTWRMGTNCRLCAASNVFQVDDVPLDYVAEEEETARDNGNIIEWVMTFKGYEFCRGSLPKCMQRCEAIECVGEDDDEPAEGEEAT